MFTAPVSHDNDRYPNGRKRYVRRVENHAQRGPKPYERRQKLMPFVMVAEKLGIDPRTAKKLWDTGVAKIGGDVFLRLPKTCECVLRTVYAIDATEHDPLQAQSLECLVASERLIL